MNRRDIPNFLGKRVQLIGLKTKSWNGKDGVVIRWSKERERFGVQFNDGSVKLFKPMNLLPLIGAKNKEEDKLYSLIHSQKLIDLNRGLLLFKKIESIETKENYLHTCMKIKWLSNLLLFKDKRYLSKLQEILEYIIRSSTFEDLVVESKLLLSECMMQQCYEGKYKTYVFDLLMTCIKNHYGQLPRIFSFLFSNSDLASTLKNGTHQDTFQILKDIYDQSKTMIVNKTCLYGVKQDFLKIVFTFLNIGRDHNLITNIPREASILREMLSTENPISGADHLAFAQAYLFEKNFKFALHHLEQHQRFASTSFGNQCHHSLPQCYVFRIMCYIELGNKPMAKRALKKLKKFLSHHPGLRNTIDEFQNCIDKMANYQHRSQMEKKKVRTNAQCSSYVCKKIESQIGDFKRCSRCQLAYYCSRKCQKKHWNAGHKEECKKC